MTFSREFNKKITETVFNRQVLDITLKIIFKYKKTQ